MTYDALNRLTSQGYSDGGRHTFVYDAVGNRTGMADASGRTTVSFDPRNLPTRIVHPGAKTVSYSYDALAQRAGMIDPDGGRFTYAYDAAGRLTCLLNPGQERTTLSYNALGRQVRQESANAVLTTQVYDAAGQQTNVIHAQSDGTVFARLTYSYDPVGNRLGMRDAAGPRRATYHGRGDRHRREGDSHRQLTG